MGLLTNAGPPPWHPATAPLRVGALKIHLCWDQCVTIPKI